jgi:hypothetical protein
VELRTPNTTRRWLKRLGAKKYNALKQLDKATQGCVLARLHVSKNVWAAHIKTWTKTWTLGTRMPKLTQAALQAPDQKNGPP